MEAHQFCKRQIGVLMVMRGQTGSLTGSAVGSGSVHGIMGRKLGIDTVDETREEEL